MNREIEKNHIEKWEHAYLKEMYPDYDYRNPQEPWNLTCDSKEGIRACSWQIKAFHYWWIIKQCRETGEIGIAVNMQDHPFCIGVHTEKGKSAIWSHYNSVHKVFESDSFPLFIATAIIPAMECTGKTSFHCDGSEIVSHIINWTSLLRKNGVLIATLLDNTGPLSQGRSLTEHNSYNHGWTSKQFEKDILPLIEEKPTICVEEFDTLKNGMAFNLVIRKLDAPLSSNG